MRNPNYNKEGIADQVENAFDGAIKLGNFFSDITEIQKKFSGKLIRQKSPIENDFWEKELQDKDVASILSDIAPILSLFTAKGLERARIIELHHKSYTLLNDSDEFTDGFDVIIDLNETWDEQAGGAVVYADEETREVEHAFGALQIVKRTNRFFQYANHYATKRRFLLLEF